jgi:hypothetical protein
VVIPGGRGFLLMALRVQEVAYESPDGNQNARRLEDARDPPSAIAGESQESGLAENHSVSARATAALEPAVKAVGEGQ